MKTNSIPIVFCALLLIANAYVLSACQKSTAQKETTSPDTITGHSVPIPITTANEMIKSYLDGIDYTSNTNEIRSYICNADSLRAYLQNPHIKYMKLFFAHTLDWINSGHRGQRPGTNQKAITIILAGVDSVEKYVPIAARMRGEAGLVLDRLDPCPDDCVGGEFIDYVE